MASIEGASAWTPGFSSIDEAFAKPRCEDADVADAVAGMRAYKEARAAEALAVEAVEALKTRKDAVAQRLALARDTARECAGLMPGGEVEAFVAACEVAATDLGAEHDEGLSKAMADLDRAGARASALRGVLVAGARELMTDRAPPEYATCPVCMDRAVSTCYVSCGHTACEECARRTSPSHVPVCPMCRRDSWFVKLHFSMGGSV